MATRTIRTRVGESPCSVSLRYGLEDCDRLDAQNPHLERSDETLPEGTEIRVPRPNAKQEALITEALNQFELFTRQPRIAFIRDENRGYADDTDCNLDPVIDQLAISNYVVDRGGDGTVPGNFPEADEYGYDPIGSKDPDHFKVQVMDNGVPDGVNEIDVTLFALKPTLGDRSFGGSGHVLEPLRDGFERSIDILRMPMHVKCRRVGQSSYFRSPYMRLATFESDRARRPEQTLLVTDFFSNKSLTDQERFHTEILHQQIEAHYKIPSCPRGLCGVSAFATLPKSHVVELAFHVFGDPATTPAMEDPIREAVYSWARRIYAPAGIRFEIRRMDMPRLPQNALFIADDMVDTRGARCSGTDRRGRPSYMQFSVDGKLIRVNLRANDTPEMTGAKIVRAIENDPALRGYRVARHVINLVGGTAANAANPCDLLVFKPARPGQMRGDPAVVSGAKSTDQLVLGPTSVQSGQTICSIDSPQWWELSPGHFPFGNGDYAASKQERALRWNHFDEFGLNIYVVPTGKLINEDNPADTPVGLGRFASVGPHRSNVGPSIYLAKDGLTSDKTTLAHECGHVLMQCYHANQPPKDTPSTPSAVRSSELMQSAADQTDQHDSARHISDAPIDAFYRVLDLDGQAHNRHMDGRERIRDEHGNATAVKDTPVNRLLHMGNVLGLLERREWIKVDPAARRDAISMEAA